MLVEGTVEGVGDLHGQLQGLIAGGPVGHCRPGHKDGSVEEACGGWSGQIELPSNYANRIPKSFSSPEATGDTIR